MSQQGRVMAWTTAIWLLTTSAYAFIYVARNVALPEAAGYEADWSWQLFFFSLVRLPLLVLALGVLLLLEHLHFRNGT